ncbi:hypothetical protein CH380_20375 [Leptospira adleri]|uniref:Uncharacterized protein n=1 Tax=Leptospira adleri TaxID=2023186 RepID=A0A2M9YIQ1_9LEPT|nr:hypothetical protein CH380_20375 [Leptospira adleri]PJZ63309.1 hypothetical protein CH376_03460 [Leptospira adleri]
MLLLPLGKNLKVGRIRRSEKQPFSRKRPEKRGVPAFLRNTKKLRFRVKSGDLELAEKIRFFRFFLECYFFKKRNPSWKVKNRIPIL